MTPKTRWGKTYWRLSPDALLMGQGDGEKPEQTRTWSISYSPEQRVLYQARYGEQTLSFVFVLIFLPRGLRQLGSCTQTVAKTEKREEESSEKGKCRHLGAQFH